MAIKHHIRRLLRSFGYDISRFTPTLNPVARQRWLFDRYRIDTVLDVGANTGRFAQSLRQDVGYRGRIWSFEPLRAAYAALARNARGDPAWGTFEYALGDREETRELHIAGNSESSSLLAMLPLHEQCAPESRYVGSETIAVKTLDAVFAGLCGSAQGIYLKIDTQGYEDRVLSGAEQSLARIALIQVEMSLAPLYRDALLFPDMCALLGAKGYRLASLEGVFSDPVSGHLLQVDGIFHRSQQVAA